MALVADSFERTQIIGDVVEYAFLLKVGPGEHDLIRLQRLLATGLSTSSLQDLIQHYRQRGNWSDFYAALGVLMTRLGQRWPMHSVIITKDQDIGRILIMVGIHELWLSLAYVYELAEG